MEARTIEYKPISMSDHDIGKHFKGFLTNIQKHANPLESIFKLL
jgi:hypothetical protein